MNTTTSSQGVLNKRDIDTSNSARETKQCGPKKSKGLNKTIEICSAVRSELSLPAPSHNGNEGATRMRIDDRTISQDGGKKISSVHVDNNPATSDSWQNESNKKPLSNAALWKKKDSSSHRMGSKENNAKSARGGIDFRHNEDDPSIMDRQQNNNPSYESENNRRNISIFNSESGSKSNYGDTLIRDTLSIFNNDPSKTILTSQDDSINSTSGENICIATDRATNDDLSGKEILTDKKSLINNETQMYDKDTDTDTDTGKLSSSKRTKKSYTIDYSKLKNNIIDDGQYRAACEAYTHVIELYGLVGHHNGDESLLDSLLLLYRRRKTTLHMRYWMVTAQYFQGAIRQTVTIADMYFTVIFPTNCRNPISVPTFTGSYIHEKDITGAVLGERINNSV